ncbi:hypothetical protein Ancab_004466 [Ancistrocladus abbreviatus]
MEHNLRRLVTGEARDQLQATGLSCCSDLHTEVCVAEKEAKIVDDASLTIHLSSDQRQHVKQILTKPYARKEDKTAMSLVSPVKILEGNIASSPLCHFNYTVPAVIFSSGGFTGNMFHELNEIIIPLFITTRHFKSEVQFVITDHRPWWVQKFSRVLKSLSRYEAIAAAGNGSVHCFPGAIIGLKYHDNLALNYTDLPTGYSMTDFRHFLWQSYNLKVKDMSIRPKNPMLALISRRKTRVFLNQDEMLKMMAELGFEVRLVFAEEMFNVDKFSHVLNSCSVMVAAHGAGLTNEVFMATGAVVVQVVPLGVDWAAETYYAKPAYDMGLKYLEYKIQVSESSLYDVYGPDHPVITNPEAILAKGYRAARALYIDEQNLTVNVVRFRETLVQAFKLLDNLPSP